jgi:hypothetical protein
MASATSLTPTAERSSPRQVFLRVHLRAWLGGGIGHPDLQAAFERAQLLELLQLLQQPHRQHRQLPQCRHPVGIQSDMTTGPAEAALAGNARGGRVTPPRNRRAAEIQRAAGVVGDHLHRIGVHECRNAGDARGQRGNGGGIMILQQLRHLADQLGRHQWLVALQVHHHVALAPARLRCHFGDAIGAGNMRQ